MISPDSNLYRNITSTYGVRGSQWLDQLPEYLQHLEGIWNLEPIQMMDNLSYHFIGQAKRKFDGQEVVVKAGCDADLLEKERQWLCHFPTSAVGILGFDSHQGALLLEKLSFGKTLKQSTEYDDDEKTLIVANTIKNLHTQSPSSLSAFKHLAELAADLDVLHGVVDKKILDKAQTVFVQLTSDRSGDRLLHGDLHHDNILRHKDSWKVIDPRGYVGDPAFEVAVMMYNPLENFSAERQLQQTLERRFAILSEQLPFDPWRMRAWTFAMAMLSTAWTYQDTQKLNGSPFSVAQELQKVDI